jgi:hypothetical protein
VSDPKCLTDGFMFRTISSPDDGFFLIS